MEGKLGQRLLVERSLLRSIEERPTRIDQLDIQRGSLLTAYFGLAEETSKLTGQPEAAILADDLARCFFDSETLPTSQKNESGLGIQTFEFPETGRMLLFTEQKRVISPMRPGELVSLSPTQRDLLSALLLHPLAVIPREVLISIIFNNEDPSLFDDSARVVLRSHMRDLREALGDIQHPFRLITTVINKGYTLNSPIQLAG